MTISPPAGALARFTILLDGVLQRLGIIRRHFALQSDRGIYLSLATLQRRRLTPSGDSGPLTSYELRCFSQNGEDGVLAEIVSRIGAGDGFFVEFGVEDAQEGNCVLLADVEGWRGLFIEADPADYARLETKYQGTPAVQTLRALVSPANVEELFAGASVPPEFDILSIDINGHDYWVWEALTSYRPRVVVIEYNSALPASKRWVQPRDRTQPWDLSDYFGSSLSACEHLAARKGYVLVHTELTGLNAFFVRQDLAGGRFPPPDRVPRRTRPNYFLEGAGWPADPLGRPYEDLDAG